MSNICFDNTSLPIYQYKSKITEIVRENQVSVIYGDTGMGKTTQIPKYILDTRLNNDLIIGISQPWRIAATSMAHRVAIELGCVCGTDVGYAVREDQRSSDSTKIKYMTDDYLLLEYHRDKLLTKYGVIMVDEAHERTIWTDLLFGILKNVLMIRTDLKVVVTSAVVITEQFSLYFNDAPILRLESRVYKVVVLYQPINGVPQAVEIVKEGLLNVRNGDYLVFLPCEEDVDDCCNRLNKIRNISVIKLDESMNSMDHIFTEPSDVKRKVIVSKNKDDTLFTMKGVKIIMDCCVAKETNYDLVTGILGYYTKAYLSKGRFDMKRDLAGCKIKGWCYRIYKNDQYDQFLDSCVPEIRRVDLNGLYLRMIDLGLEPDNFDFLEKPESEKLSKCKRRLWNLQIIDVSNHVTDFGRMVVKVLLNLALGKAMISSYEANRSNDIVTGFLMMAERNIFQTPLDDIIYKEFHDVDGDLFTGIKVYNEFEKSGKTKEWCETKRLHYDALQRLDRLRDDVLKVLGRLCKIRLSNCASINKYDIKCSLVMEYYGNICVKTKDDTYRNCLSNVIMYMDPNSSLYKSKPAVILFHECIQSGEKPIMYGILKLKQNLLTKYDYKIQLIKYQFGIQSMPVTETSNNVCCSPDIDEHQYISKQLSKLHKQSGKSNGKTVKFLIEEGSEISRTPTPILEASNNVGCGPGMDEHQYISKRQSKPLRSPKSKRKTAKYLKTSNNVGCGPGMNEHQYISKRQSKPLRSRKSKRKRRKYLNEFYEFDEHCYIYEHYGLEPPISKWKPRHPMRPWRCYKRTAKYLKTRSQVCCYNDRCDDIDNCTDTTECIHQTKHRHNIDYHTSPITDYYNSYSDYEN